MPQVVVTIAGRTFKMACDAGDEPRLAALAGKLDRRIAAMRGSFGEIGELSLTVMAAMAATDELEAAEERAARLERRVGAHEAQPGGSGAANGSADRGERAQFAAMLEETAVSLERIGQRLSRGETSDRGS